MILHTDIISVDQNECSTNLLLVYHMCDDILGGKIESILSRIPEPVHFNHDSLFRPYLVYLEQ